VIDYVIGKGEVKSRVERMRIGDRVDSDHQPIEVWLKGERVRGEGGKVGERLWRGAWSEEGRNRFRQKLGGLELRERGLEEEWEMEGRLKGIMNSPSGATLTWWESLRCLSPPGRFS